MNNLIVIAGMARGGTNILWNIVQSHPQVIDTYYELNEIYGIKKTNSSFFKKLLVEASALYNVHMPFVEKLTKERLIRFAKHSFANDVYNKYKYEDQLYKQEDFENLTICTKLVSSWERDPIRELLKRNDALKYIPILKKTVPKIKIVFLIRNGLAMAESWKRRGADIKTAAKWYRKYVLYYEDYCKLHSENSMLIKYEDMMDNPFEISEKIFQKLELNPVKLAKLRIALKPTIKDASRVNTTQKEKVWVSKENYRDVLDSDINNAQIKNLTNEEIKYFTEQNRDLLEKYGYLEKR